MNVFFKSLSLLSYNEKKQGLFILVLVILMGLFEAVGIASILPFLSVLGDPSIVSSNSLLSSMFNFLKRYGLSNLDDFFICLGIGSFVLLLSSTIYKSVVTFLINNFIEMRQHSLACNLLKAFTSQNYEYFLGRNGSDMSNSILSQTNQIVNTVFRPGVNLLAYSIVLIFIVILLLIINPLVAVSAVLMLSILYYIIFSILKPKISILGDTHMAASKNRFLQASEVFGGIKAIKLSGTENTYLGKFHIASHSFASALAKLISLQTIPHLLVEASIFGAIILLTLVLLLLNGGLSGSSLGNVLPILGIYGLAAVRMKPAFSHVYSGFSSFRFGKATLDDVLKQLNDCKEVPIISGIKKDKMMLNSKISFTDVSFTYPNSDTHSIDSVSLEIPIGTSFGIVGSTGAGKTTFVDIFLGLLDPTSGTIKIGDHQLTIDNKSNWQNCLGYVPQEIFLSDNSLAENIAFGVDKSEIEYAKVEKCARLAQIHDFVCNELPDRYDSMVGERGIRLSGGQRQRIGIARALYNDPDILVFDEATSALDSLTEKEVMHSIESLSEIKTVIIIAHRLTTVKNCNKIAILEKGRIKALGKYDDLIISDKYFQKLAGA